MEAFERQTELGCVAELSGFWTMKTLKTYHLFLRALPRQIRIAAAAIFFAVITTQAMAQQYISQDGHLLDANPALGSFGWNTPARLDALVPRANLYITGNIRGGQSFQGLVPYHSPFEFQSNLGSSALSDFIRDSAGSDTLSSPVGRPQAYVDPTRQITGFFGNNVTTSSRYFRQSNLTPIGTTLLSEGVGPQLSTRPLSQPYMAINAPPGEFAPVYQQMRQAATELEGRPLGTLTAPNEPLQKNFLTTPTPRTPQPSETTATPAGSIVRPEFTNPPQPIPENLAASTAPIRTESQKSDYYQQLEKQWQLSSPSSESITTPETPGETEGKSATRLPLETPATVMTPQQRVASLGAGKESADQFSRRQFTNFMSKGEQYMRQGRYYQAADAFGNAAFYNTANPLVWLAQSHALFAAGEFMSSAFYLNKCLSLAVPPPGGDVDLKRIFPGAEEFNKRYEDLKKSQERSQEPMMLFLRGYIEYQTGDLASAVGTLTQAAQLLPNTPAVGKLLAAAQQAQADTKK
jgi:hypothetical protein